MEQCMLKERIFGLLSLFSLIVSLQPNSTLPSKFTLATCPKNEKYTFYNWKKEHKEALGAGRDPVRSPLLQKNE